MNPRLPITKTHPSKVEPEVYRDLVCRFLMHLPDEEKEMPRLFLNIKEAMFYFCDQLCAKAPNTDFKFERDFAQQIFLHWPFLACKAGNFA